MTVGSNVKGCYFSLKSAEATFEQLAIKTNVAESKNAFISAQEILSEINGDLQKQLVYLEKEEPQYK